MRTDVIILIIIILIVFVYLQNKNENFRSGFNVPVCESIQGCLQDYSGNILQIINLGDVKNQLNNQGPNSYGCEEECSKYKTTGYGRRRRSTCIEHSYVYNGVSSPRISLKSKDFNDLVVHTINNKQVQDNKFILVQAGFGDFSAKRGCRYPTRQTWILFFKANKKIYRLENSDDTFDFTFTLTTEGKINTYHAMPGTKNNRDIRYLRLIDEDKKANLKFEYYKNNTRIKILTKNGKEFEDMRFDLVPVN